MISAQDIKDNNLTEDEIIEIIMEVTGEDRAGAEFIFAIETGIHDGDVVITDEDGKPVREQETNE